MATERLSPKPLINLRGQKVGLGPIRRDLIDAYMRWMNDFEIVCNVQRIVPMTREAEEAWYQRASAGARDGPESFTFAIYELKTLRPIGNAGLIDINRANQTAEFGIVIGEKDCWNRGYGTEATRLTLDFGFNAQNLHNIRLRVYGFNQRAIRAYEKAGFRTVGRLREAHVLNGRRYDVVLMDCLATEFVSPCMKRLTEEPEQRPKPRQRGTR